MDGFHIRTELIRSFSNADLQRSPFTVNPHPPRRLPAAPRGFGLQPEANGWPLPVTVNDPLRVGVDVEPLAAREADEGDPADLRALDRQAGRRRHGHEHRNSGQAGLLNDLERS